MEMKVKRTQPSARLNRGPEAAGKAFSGGERARVPRIVRSARPEIGSSGAASAPSERKPFRYHAASINIGTEAVPLPATGNHVGAGAVSLQRAFVWRLRFDLRAVERGIRHDVAAEHLLPASHFGLDRRGDAGDRLFGCAGAEVKRVGEQPGRTAVRCGIPGGRPFALKVVTSPGAGAMPDEHGLPAMEEEARIQLVATLAPG